MSNTEYSDEVLEVASEAGHILLENGAEISRVEDTMERISSHYGVNSGHFFVLSNGIFTTSSASKYANVEFIPLRGIQLSKVVAVNRLSFDIAAGYVTLLQNLLGNRFWAQQQVLVVSVPCSAVVSWIAPLHL